MKDFEALFSPYQEQLMAIYGLGEATKEILKQAGGRFHIVGLLDGSQRDGEMYGMPVLPLEELPSRGCSLIVIAARPSSCRIIRNRILEFCREYDIKLFDVDGNILSEESSVVAKEVLAVGVSRNELLRQIDTHDVVSFDIFDTLLTRRALCPEVVFGLVQRSIPKEWQISEYFCRERELAERELSRGGVPTWEEIYQYLAERNGLSTYQIEKLKQLEWQMEEAVLTRREEVYQVLQYALKQGKKVFIVSDMYFSERQLAQLLEKNGVTGYEKIFVSCEYGITKGQGLFRFLLEEVGGMSIIHIGDSQAADVDCAKRYGIAGMRLPGALEQLERSGLLERLGEDIGEEGLREDALARELKRGMFATRLFNSPFSSPGRTVELNAPEDIGYLLLAPILTDFTIWLWHRVRESSEETVLFGARDGYLVKQLFDDLQRWQGGGKQPESIYFLTSRLCAVLAGCSTPKDVEYVAGLGFDGSFEQMLQTRFLLAEEDVAVGGKGIDDYLQVILDRALEKRKCYQTYIKGLKLKQGKKSFFDFVSTGTCQVALQKIMGEKLRGYYFMRVEEDCDEKRSLNIESFYVPEDAKGVYEDAFLLENILTSPFPSLQTFEAGGQPQYLPEDRTATELAFIEKVHQGIREYFQCYLEIWGVEESEESREISRCILNLLHNIPIVNGTFQKLQWTDAFYGRKEKVGDLA